MAQPKPKPISLRIQLFIGYSIILLILILQSTLTYQNIVKNQELVKWTDHTLKVIYSGEYLKKMLVDMETGQRGYLITGKANFLEPYESGREGFKSTYQHAVNLVSDNESQVVLLGEIKQLEELWLEKAARPEIALRTQVNQGLATMQDISSLIAKETGKKMMDELRSLLSLFISVEEQLLLSRELEVVEADTLMINQIIFGTLIAIGLGLLLIYITIRMVTKPIIEISKLTKKVSAGDLSTRIKVIGSDEVGELANSINKMVGSLEKAETQMQRSNAVLEEQSTLKTQIANITELTQGATELESLCDQMISALAGMTHAGHGVIYVNVQADTQLVLMGSYAFKQRKNVLPHIAIGEGLVGQCAKEKKSILLTQAPSDYIQINSALGEQVPLNILVVPVLFEKQLVAVIELASFEVFSEQQQIMLAQVAGNIGIVINTIFNQQQTQSLLLETQRQSEELQAQQEELKSSNENLLEQTHLLKASEEELKQQSEELTVSNQELSEKQRALQQQKEAIEASQQNLSIKAQELALASKYKSEFLANMSHELRTPLNSLLLLSKSLAKNSKGNLDATDVEDAKIIYEGGQSLLTIINDILDLSKVEAGKLGVHLEEVKIASLCRNMQSMFKVVSENKGVKFNIEVAATVPEVIISDGHRVEQILRNLLSNALKFTESGSVTLSITNAVTGVCFTHSALSADSAIALSVIDTGIGIAKDKLQQIFEAFQQQDGSISRKFGGTGLGLTIARELSLLLGGEIQVLSEQGNGSTFTLFLPLELLTPMQEMQAVSTPERTSEVTPLAPVSAETTATQTSELSEHSFPVFIADDRANIRPGDKSLLVIDEDKEFAAVIRDLAKQQGYKCLVAGDGRSGVYMAQKNLPDGIVLDLRLPGIDGHEVLEQLKFSLKTRNIPVQIISNHAEHSVQALQKGAIGMLIKPVSEKQLQDVLAKISNINSADIKRVLIIEDDQDNRRAVTQLLEGSTVDINSVATGREGCSEILSEKYDCVILDLGLPDMTGFEVLENIHLGPKQNLPPIIVYTGKELTDDEQKKLQKYSSAIVIKGVGSPERLLDDVSLFLHNIEAQHSSDDSNIHILHDEDAMLKGRKILLVDDDMRNSYALSKHLMGIGFEVEIAANGQEALDLLEADSSFELVLMDIMMPVMDGIEATERIRQMTHYSNLPLIALTAKTMPEDREKCMRAGASEFLTKPIDFDNLLSIIRIWLFKRT